MFRRDVQWWLTSVVGVRRRLFTTSVIAVFAATAVWVGASAASAYELNGCKYDSAQPPSITYKGHSLPAAYAAAVSTGQFNWDGKTGSTTYFVSTTSSDPNIDIYTVSSIPGGASALMTGACWPVGTWKYDEVRIDFATSVMDSYSADAKARVAAHELGHAYGLAHESANCASSPAVMWNSTAMFGCWGSWPWADDVAGWDSLY